MKHSVSVLIVKKFDLNELEKNMRHLSAAATFAFGLLIVTDLHAQETLGNIFTNKELHKSVQLIERQQQALQNGDAPQTKFKNVPDTDADVALLTSDDALSCEEANELMKEDGQSKDYYLWAFARQQACLTQSFNDKMSDIGLEDRKVAVGGVDNEGKYFFDILDVEDVEKFTDVCTKILTIAGVANDFDAGISAAFGGVTCGSYAEALVEENPLIFIAPLTIPGLSLLKGNKITRGLATDIDNAIKKLPSRIEGAVNAEVENIQNGKPSPVDVVAPLVTAPIKVVCKIFKC